MKKNPTLAFLLLFFTTSYPVFSMEFEDVWIRFQAHSQELIALGHEREASETALNRAELHWLPKVSLMGQWMDTNDSGPVLFNQLGQRSMGQTDFVPSQLNHPGRQQFLTGTLGVDLPLYEGGMKMGQLSIQKALLGSRKKMIQAKQTEQFSELAAKYGSIIIYQHNLIALQNLKKELSKIIANYQVGSKANPLGHSGLLGLKGLSNRMEGLVLLYEHKLRDHKEWILTKAGIDGNWNPSETSLHDYVSRHLEEISNNDFSSIVASQELMASTLDLTPKVEQARYLPKLGLFAQNQLYSGDRSTENAQSFGIYLKWELFSSDSYNRTDEARSQARAASARIKSMKQDETLLRKKLLDSQSTLSSGLGLLKTNSDLLNEQAQTSMKLFKAGLMNALQLTEVINRRVDVVEQKNEAELQYLEVRAGLYKLSH